MATQGVQMNFWGVQNATFDENPYESERIRVILGCAISSIARAKHRCTGGWLILCLQDSFNLALFCGIHEKYAMWKFIVDVVHDFVSSLQPDVGRGFLHVSNMFLF